MIAKRLADCGLELNEQKTRIVYCKDDDRRGSYEHTSFDFLSYTFRPRLSKNKYGKHFLNFTPAVSREAKTRMRRETDYDRALEQLKRLATELEHTHPGAAGSLREGMQETLTVIKLGIRGKLRRTLESTNPCESMIDTVRRTQRNVKRWRDGEMGLRWTAAGMLEAEKQFRKVIGYTQLAQLAIAIERRLALPQPNHAPTTEAAIVAAA